MKLTAEGLRLFLYKYSILPPLLGFTIGILLSEHISEPLITILVTGLIFGFLAIFFVHFRFLIFIPLGLLFASNPLLNQDTNIEHYINKKIDIEGTLYRSPEQREYGSRLYIDTDTVIVEGQLRHTSGKVIINSGEFIQALSYGDRLRVLGVELRGLRNFQNPGSFDLKSFYERQGIRASGFTDGEEYIISFGRASSTNPLLTT